jgi:hypothetical protein
VRIVIICKVETLVEIGKTVSKTWDSFDENERAIIIVVFSALFAAISFSF